MPKLSASLALLISLFSLSATSSPPECVGTRATANVRVKIVAAVSGDSDLGNGMINLFENVATGRNYADHFRDNSAAGIPVGTYHLSVYREGFHPANRLVEVRESFVSVLVGVQLGRECGPFGSELTGEIRPANPSMQAWARLSGVRFSVQVDAPVDPSGKFSFTDLAPDDYTLVVWAGSEVLDVRSVRVGSAKQTPIVIRLGQ